MLAHRGSLRQPGVLAELLPLRGGKPPAVKKAVRPAMRDAARRLRGAGRALADSLLSFPSPTVAAVRRPPAGGAGEGWGGLAEVLEGLDALADMEEERGAAQQEHRRWDTVSGGKRSETVRQ